MPTANTDPIQPAGSGSTRVEEATAQRPEEGTGAKRGHADDEIQTVDHTKDPGPRTAGGGGEKAY